MKKASSGRNLDVNLDMMPIRKCCPLIYSFKLFMCQDPRIARAYTARNTKIITLLACLVQHLSAFTSWCRTDKAGRGALEPPSEDGGRTKRFDREIPVPRIPY